MYFNSSVTAQYFPVLCSYLLRCYLHSLKSCKTSKFYKEKTEISMLWVIIIKILNLYDEICTRSHHGWTRKARPSMMRPRTYFTVQIQYFIIMDFSSNMWYEQSMYLYKYSEQILHWVASTAMKWLYGLWSGIWATYWHFVSFWCCGWA